MKKSLKQITFAVLVIFLVFAGLEGVSRLNDWLQDDFFKKVGEETLAFNISDLNPYVFFRSLPSLELRPNATFFFKFNGKIVRAQKDPREYRIFILGGSVAQGYGASSPEKRFYRLLEKKLNGTEPKNFKFNVISAGRLGYVSAQELVFLMMGVLDFKPNLVVHLNGANDILTVLQYQESPGYPFYFQTLNRALEAVKIGKVIDQALNKSTFLKVLEQMFRKYRSSAPQLASQNIARHYKRNMTQSAQLLKANEIAGLFILQPLLIGKLAKSAQEKKQIRQFKTQDRMFWEETYPRLSKSLETLPNMGDMAWMSFQSVFDGISENIFTDTIHLNDRGQKLLADVLFNAIRENVLDKTAN